MKARIKFYICVIGVLFLTQNAVAATLQKVIPTLIPELKRRVVPVVCKLPNDSISQGTAVLVGFPGERLFALTCEHVLATKDTTGKTLQYASEIVLFWNLKDGSSVPINARLIHTDEKYDFALLAIPIEKVLQSLIDELQKPVFQPSLWKKTSDIKEGESVIYIGYPMAKGIGKKSYPLSRMGIVSQLVPGRPFFLIDGFVQHGHSGSPVFLIREEGNQTPPDWNFYLIGITTSFPDEYSNLYEDVRLKKIAGTKVLINPGFTNVTAMDKIIPILKQKSGIKR